MESILLLAVPVSSITLSADGTSALVTTLDSHHRLFDMLDGSVLQTFEGHVNVSYRCHSTLSHDEAHVLAGDENGRLAAWEVLTGKMTTLAQPITEDQAQVGKQKNRALLWTEVSAAKGTDAVLTAGADGVLKVYSHNVTSTS